MSKLKALNFIAAPKTINDPVVRRRAKLMERVRLQIQLYENPELKITEQKWQRREHLSPRIINVAVLLSKHSPMFGQRASSQTVCRSFDRIRS